ncbi:MAG: class I SAM-dependent methyltransferase [Microthrixaceae bacterium]
MSNDPQDPGDRKLLEQELHDHLRDEHATIDPRALANKKYYAVDRANVDFVHDWLQERVAGKRVLDYCCGQGIYTLWLAAHGAEAYGIDISPVSVERGRHEASRLGLDSAHFEVMDAEEIAFEDGFFDYVVINGVLHHLDLDKSYAELARVLSPTGSVVATEALRHNPIIHLYRKRTPLARSIWEVDHILGRPEIFRAQEYFGEVRILRWFHLATIGAVPLRNAALFKRVLALLEAVDRVILRLPGLRWMAWMAVFELREPRARRDGDKT